MQTPASFPTSSRTKRARWGDRGACHPATTHRHPDAHIWHSDLHRCLVVPDTLHLHDWRHAPSPRTVDNASNHELCINQAVGEAGTKESTHCDVKPSEKANCAFVSTTSISPQHERSTMPCTAASDELNSVARRNATFTMRCKCGAPEGTNASCWLSCAPGGNARHPKRRRGKVVLPCQSQDGCGTAARSVLASSVHPSRAAHRTVGCFGRTRACVPSQRALHVHQPAIACFRWHHAAVQTSSSFASQRQRHAQRDAQQPNEFSQNTGTNSSSRTACVFILQ